MTIRELSDKPDFTYGSPEEFYYCQWIRIRRPPGTADDKWQLWLAQRQAFVAEYLREEAMSEKANESGVRPSAGDPRDPVAQADRELTFYRAVLEAAIVAGKGPQAEEMRRAITFWEQRRATVQDWERP